MNTYQIDYYHHNTWNPGLIVKMEPQHLKFYLEFLAGERPVVSAHGPGRINRCQKRCLPTRVRHVNPDWSQEDGYYEFDGMSLHYVRLTNKPRLMHREKRRKA